MKNIIKIINSTLSIAIIGGIFILFNSYIQLYASRESVVGTSINTKEQETAKVKKETYLKALNLAERKVLSSNNNMVVDNEQLVKLCPDEPEIRIVRETYNELVVNSSSEKVLIKFSTIFQLYDEKGNKKEPVSYKEVEAFRAIIREELKMPKIDIGKKNEYTNFISLNNCLIYKNIDKAYD